MFAFVTTADAYNKTKTFAKISMTATNYNVCKINPFCNKLRWLQQTRRKSLTHNLYRKRALEGEFGNPN